MAGEGQAPALDRIGDEAGRPVGLRRLVEGLHDGRHVMAAEIGHQAMQARIIVGSEHALVAEIRAMARLQFAAEARPALEGQRGIEIVGAIVDPALQGIAARLGEGRAQQLAVFQRDDVPADRGEEGLDLLEELVRHHAVEALAVVVDDPPEIPDLMLPAFQQGLEDIAPSSSASPISAIIRPGARPSRPWVWR
jgi:hypothetical protein